MRLGNIKCMRLVWRGHVITVCGVDRARSLIIGRPCYTPAPCNMTARTETVPLAPSPQAGFFVMNDASQIQIACARVKNLLSMILISQGCSVAKKSELPREVCHCIAKFLIRQTC